MVASSYPQFGWVAPQPLSSTHNSHDVIAPAVSAAAPPDQQQLNAMSLDAVRQSIDRIATGFAASQEQITRSVDRIAPSVAANQEQMTRSIDRIAPSVAANQEQMTRSIDRIAASQEEMARSINRLTTGQELMTREITKLQEIAQYALYKNSEPPVQPATPPARKPVPRSSQAPTALTPARNP
jgi:hypothetical protein